jgi:hypothetical protein
MCCTAREAPEDEVKSLLNVNEDDDEPVGVVFVVDDDISEW